MPLLQADTVWGRPAGEGTGVAALVLAGYSGRIDSARVDLLAADLDRRVLVGLSYGAEEALLAATVAPPPAPSRRRDGADRCRLGGARRRRRDTAAGGRSTATPVTLPGEAVPDLGRSHLVGGDEGAPGRPGRLAWPHLARLLQLTRPARTRLARQDGEPDTDREATP